MILHYDILHWYVHFTMQYLYLIEFSAEAFRCHVQHYQCLAVPVELTAMEFVFQLMVIEIAEMLVCDCVKYLVSFVM